MQIKKFTQKNADGSSVSYEFDVPPRQEIPKYDHPGDPKGTDTVPAWLTPGEFVVNAEATRMFKPQIEAMNEQGKAVQAAQGGTVPSYYAKGGKAGPCWDGYEMVGMKEKGGKQVPNCVPVDYKACGGKVHYKATGGGVEQYLGSAYDTVEGIAGDYYNALESLAGQGYDAFQSLVGSDQPSANMLQVPQFAMAQPEATTIPVKEVGGVTPEGYRLSEDQIKQYASTMSDTPYPVETLMNETGIDKLRAKKYLGITDVYSGRGEAAGAVPPASSPKVYSGRGKSEGADSPYLSWLTDMRDKGITDPKAQAGVLAQIEAESKFNPRSENLNYSPERLIEVFPSKFKDLDDAKAVVSQGQEAIGNRIYGGRMGNAPDEGYKYRGRGFIQITGKDNYERYGNMIGVDLVNNPDLANDPEVARKIAIAYMQDRGTDLTDPEANTKAVGPAGWRGKVDERAGFQQDILEKITDAADVPQIFNQAYANADQPTGDYFPSSVSAERIDSLVPEAGVNAPPPQPEEGFTSYAVDSTADVPQPEDIPKSPEQIREEISTRNAQINPAGFSIETAGDGRYNILNKQGQSMATVGSLELADQWISNNVTDRVANTESEAKDNSEALEVIAGQKKMAAARGDEELLKSLEEREAELKAEQENPLVLGTQSKEESDAVRELVGKPDMKPEGMGGEPPAPESPKVEAANNIVKATDNLVTEQDLANAEQMQADLDSGKIENAAMQAPEGAMDKVMGFFEEYGITDLFDKKELGKMAVMYLGSRLLGHSHGGSLNFAAKNYISGVSTKQATKAKNVQKLLEDGKFTPASIARYEKSGNIEDLVKKGLTFIPTGDTETIVYMNPKTKKKSRIKVRKVKGSDDGYYYQANDGTIINTLSSSVQEYKPEMWEGTPEYNTYSIEAEKAALDSFKSVANVEENMDEDGNLIVPIAPDKAARQFVSWARTMGLDPKDPKVRAMIGDAYTQAIRENKGQELKATELEPYLTRMTLMQEEGRIDLYERKDSDGKGTGTFISPPDLAMLRAKVKEETQEIMSRRSTPVTTKQILDYAASRWESLGPDGQQKYHDAARDGRSSGFAKYLEEQLDANKYDRITK